MRWRWLSFWRRTTSEQPVPRQRAWSRLPPLRITVSPHPPVLVPLLHRPAIATTRNPLKRRPSTRPTAIAAPNLDTPDLDVPGIEVLDFEAPGIDMPDIEAPARGSVTGLVRAFHTAQPEFAPDVDASPIEPEPPSVPVVRPLPSVDRPGEPLTRAVDTYVGEPTAPDVPYRASSFNRLLAQFDGEPNGLAQAAMLALGGMSSQTSAPPPRAGESDHAPEEPKPSGQQQQASGQRQLRRRPNLAQSRRLGLAGRPGKPPEPDPPLRSDPPELADEIPVPPSPDTPSPEVPPTRRLGLGAPLTHERPARQPDANPARPPDTETPPNGEAPPLAHERPARQPDANPARPPNTETPPNGEAPPLAHERPARQPDANPARPPDTETPPGGEALPLTLVYRTAPLDPLPPPVEDEPMRREPVPVELAAEFRTRFDVDVTEVPIYRGPAVTPLANAASARAFTQRGTVYLPDEAGELSDPDGRALLAHELVHVAQQRVLGASLPEEGSPQGAQLEATAAATQRWLRDGTTPPPTLIPPPNHPPGTPSAPTTFIHQPSPVPAPPPAPTTETHLQRAAVEGPGQSFDLDTLLSSARADGREPPTSITAVATESGPVRFTTPQPVPVLPDPAIATPDVDGLRGRIEQLASAVDELATARSATPERPGIANGSEVDELARRLYPRIRDNLRHELIIDRERAGRLSDLR